MVQAEIQTDFSICNRTLVSLHGTVPSYGELIRSKANTPVICDPPIAALENAVKSRTQSQLKTDHVLHSDTWITSSCPAA